jgi:hypothetical protein
MGGLLLGFVLRVAGRPAEQIVSGGLLAEAVFNDGLRAVVWFPTFALLERIAWTGRARAVALAAGVAALLLNLTVSGGISFPAVAGPLWVAAALALNASPGPPLRWGGRARPALALPLPVLAAVTLAYLVYVFAPVTSSAGLVRQALGAGQPFLADVRKKPEERPLRSNPRGYLQKKVIDPLGQAAHEDPEDAHIPNLLAFWYSQVWGVTVPRNDRLIERAKDWAARAQLLAPNVRDGYQTEYDIRRLSAERYAELAKKQPDKAKLMRAQYRMAADALRGYLPNDPTDAPLRYFIARALYHAEERPAEAEEWKTQAREALRLDELQNRPDEPAKRRPRRLSPEQRKELEGWLKESSGS